MMDWHYWQQQLELEEHPEGGFYKRIYTAPQLCHPAQGPRPSMTAIHYLLHGSHQSRWHRLQSDEHWFYHQGCGLYLMAITPDGALLEHRVDSAHPYVCISAGHWFCARVQDTHHDSFALVSCTVTPGFDFADFELLESHILAAQYPQHRDKILLIRAAGG